MNFSTTVDKIKNALLHTQLVTTKQSSLEVLQGVYISVTKSGGVVRATNLSVGVEVSFPAEVQQEGTIVCDPGLLLGVISTLPSQSNITCVVDGTTLTLSTSTSESNIKLLASEDFPTLPRLEQAPSFSVNAQDLVSLWQSVVYAASTSDIKPEISSVFMYIDEQQNLVCVSTDSFRLAEKKLPLIDAPGLDGIMIPVKNITTLMRIFNEEGGDITITYSDTQIIFTTNTHYCVTRLIDGNYPAYQTILPTEFNTTVTLLKNDLIQNLKALNIFADKFYQVDMTADLENKTLIMNSHHPERGTHTSNLPVVVEGETIDMRCNAKYLQDCLASITTDSIVMKFVAGNKPFIIAPLGDETFQYLVMPLNK